MLASQSKANLGTPCTITISIPHQSTTFPVAATTSDSVLDLAATDPVLNELIAGSCGGNMSCSTCHVLLRSPSEYAASLSECTTPHNLDDAELDMLELAAGYEEGVSRLGCQVKCGEGMVVEIPEEVVDLWQ